MAQSESTKWVRLGDYIEQCDERAKDKFTVDDVIGMTITKEIIPTKADLKDADLSKFLVVKPEEFIYNPRTHGKKIGLGYNNTRRNYIISWNNTAFKVKDTSILLPGYLYLLLSREEWDREACFRSWGSSTEVFSWVEFGLMKIPLPSIEVQRELVETYNGIKAIAEQNEALYQRLSIACHAYIVDCRAKYDAVPLGDYIEQCDERAGDNYTVNDVIGISTDKKFIVTKANMSGVSINSYKVVNPFEFAYVADTSRRGDKIALALNNSDNPVLISSIYTAFRSKDSNQLLPEYLFMILNRTEFDRYARFNSWGSARETFDWEEMCRVEIPLPDVKVQKAIVDVFNCADRAKKIATEARERLKTLCPALVQRAANS